MTKITGNAFTYTRDDIDTDLIIPARYLTTSDQAELAIHAMEPLGNAELLKGPDPIVVAGKNFGCGSSREHAVWALVGAGVKAVVADSFARIYFRNSVNFGLFPVVLAGASEKIKQGDKLEIDTERNTVKNLTQGTEHPFEPIPEFLREIVIAGGLLNTLSK